MKTVQVKNIYGNWIRVRYFDIDITGSSHFMISSEKIFWSYYYVANWFYKKAGVHEGWFLYCYWLDFSIIQDKKDMIFQRLNFWLEPLSEMGVSSCYKCIVSYRNKKLDLLVRDPYSMLMLNKSERELCQSWINSLKVGVIPET